MFWCKKLKTENDQVYLCPAVDNNIMRLPWQTIISRGAKNCKIRNSSTK